MCFLAVKNYSLEKRLVKLEQEAKSLKTEQKYGTIQAKSFMSNVVSENSIATYIATTGIDVNGLHLRLTFTGENENKIVVGVPSISISGVSEEVVSTYYLSSPVRNQIVFDVYVQHLHFPVPLSPGDQFYSNPFTVETYMKTNQHGHLDVSLKEGLNGII